MQERDPTTMERLLERLLSVRARRDREERFSEGWRAADAELHAIEEAIFRVPSEGTATGKTPRKNRDPAGGNPRGLGDRRQTRNDAGAAKRRTQDG